MSYANASLKQRSFGETMRRGAWWTQPLFIFLGLSTFLVYSTWAAFQGNHYWLAKWRELSFAVLLAGILGHLAACHLASPAGGRLGAISRRRF